MAPGGINTDTFRLTEGTKAVAGTVSFEVGNRVGVFTPATGLAPNQRYTATIVTGIEDLAGNALGTDFAWCFVTTGSADTTIPVVIATGPADAGTDFPLNQKISATFSQDMSASSLAAARFRLTGPGTTLVSGAVAYRGRTAVFTPGSKLASNASYTARGGGDEPGQRGTGCSDRRPNQRSAQ